KEAVAVKSVLGAGGVKSVGAKTMGFLATPVFGMIALMGVIGWELWQAKKDSDAIKAKRAAAA
ncbi:MAG: hypothetical protein GY801_26355, partial [bacterium]|nr:hypothetical protein [bacterium]